MSIYSSVARNHSVVVGYSSPSTCGWAFALPAGCASIDMPASCVPMGSRGSTAHRRGALKARGRRRLKGRQRRGGAPRPTGSGSAQCSGAPAVRPGRPHRAAGRGEESTPPALRHPLLVRAHAAAPVAGLRAYAPPETPTTPRGVARAGGPARARVGPQPEGPHVLVQDRCLGGALDGRHAPAGLR